MYLPMIDHPSADPCRDSLDIHAVIEAGHVKRLMLLLLLLAASCLITIGAARHLQPAAPIDPLQAPCRNPRTALVIDLYYVNFGQPTLPVYRIQWYPTSELVALA
jgi:hypothetical protein